MLLSGEGVTYHKNDVWNNKNIIYGWTCCITMITYTCTFHNIKRETEYIGFYGKHDHDDKSLHGYTFEITVINMNKQKQCNIVRIYVL